MPSTPTPPGIRIEPARPSPALVAAMIAAFLGALLLYVSGAAPGVLYGDSGELQSVALVGGITHPSGYPTFVMVGRLFALLPFAEPAFRITFMSAFFGAVSVALVVALLVRLGASVAGALAGAILYGLSFTFWTGSLRAEVYTLALCLMLLALERSVVALRGGRLIDALVAGLLLGVSMTGHFMFAPLVAVFGLALAWRMARRRGPVVIRLAALLLAFLVGLSPFLYLFWADGQHFPMNYFDQVRRVVAPLGGPIPGFETTAERVKWLLTGRNSFPPVPYVFVLHTFALAIVLSATVLLLFEFGPLAAPLVFAGLRRQGRDERGLALLFLAAAALSILFASALVYGGLLFVFLAPATLITALWIGLGLDGAIRRVAPRARPVLVYGLAIAAPLVLALTAQAVRLYSDDHPIGPRKFRTFQEDDRAVRMRSITPSMRAFDEPQRFAERMAVAVPESALVVAEFREMAVMYYVTRVLGLRRDLALAPWGPNVLDGVAAWQQAKDLRRRPVVFLSRLARWWRHAAAVDSLPAIDGRSIYVVRTPLSIPAPGRPSAGSTVERPEEPVLEGVAQPSRR